MYLRNRVYTPNSEQKHKANLKHFYETNEFGLDQNQLKALELRRSVADGWTQLNQTELGDGSVLITKEKNLKVFKEETS